MRTSDLVAAVAKTTNLTRKEAHIAVRAVCDSIVQALARKEDVRIDGAGRIYIKQLSGRAGVKLVDGSTIDTLPTNVIRFKATGPLRLHINKHKESERAHRRAVAVEFFKKRHAEKLAAEQEAEKETEKETA